MLFEDQYKTIRQCSEGIFRDKGSKFIAYAYPITSEREIKPILLELKAAHQKARHFCWAYRLTPDRSIFRINDDGEPSGTAGRPILNSLLSAELTNIFVVVVRYFGGTLLGVPGLINAYKSATNEALKAATIIEQTVDEVYVISFPYAITNQVMKVIKDERVIVSSQEFNLDCKLEIQLRKSIRELILGKLTGLEGLSVHFVRVN
jgi:uncharacterized YigZ family protein